MAAASDRSVSVRFGGKRLLSLAAACGLQRIGRLYAFGVPHLSHPAGADGPAEDAPFGPR